MQRFRVDRINWKGHKEEFLNSNFPNLNRRERVIWLKERGWQFRDVPQCRDCGHVYINCICIIRDEEHEKEKAERRARLKDSFDEKLAYSRKLVKRVLEEHEGEKILLAYSAGIDSECCVQLFKNAIIEGKVEVIFGNTRVNYLDAYIRVNELEKELGIKVKRFTPEKGVTFEKIIKRMGGLPLSSRGFSTSKEEANRTRMCCELLKKRPMKKATKNADVLIMGLRMTENQYRRLNILRYGDYYYAKSYKQYRVSPIAFWTLEDEWKFQKKLGFNYNRLYDFKYELPDGTLYKPRTGCWCCPQPCYKIGHLEWLEKFYPRQFKILMLNYGLFKHITFKKINGKFWRIKREKKRISKPCE